MGNPVIVDAARTPYGRRGGGLAGLHAAELLGIAQRGILDRSGPGPDPGRAGHRRLRHPGRRAVRQRHADGVAARGPARAGRWVTVDCQCGSAQQAVHLVAALIAAGAIDIGMACGVEMMSRVPLRQHRRRGRPATTGLLVPDMPNQFVAADRIAPRRGFTRADLDAFGLRSQQRAPQAWADGRLARQIIPVEVPGPDGAQPAVARRATRGCATPAWRRSPRSTGAGGRAAHRRHRLADLRRGRRRRPDGRGPRPRAGAAPARPIVSQCLVGAEPYYLLDGPVQAAARLLDRTGMTLDDIDLFEVNEAFAAMPMSFQRCTTSTRTGSTSTAARSRSATPSARPASG